MYEQWEKSQLMTGTIPPERYEEFIMSHTSELGMGIRTEMGKEYYYAFIMLYLNGEKYCRYSFVSKEEYEAGIKEYDYCSEPDGITSLNYYNKYILNHEILYDGIYNENVFKHYLREIKQMNVANQGGTDISSYKNIYNVIAGKEWKQITIILIIVSTIFVAALMLKKFLPDLLEEKIWFNLVWMFAFIFEIGFGVMFIWMIYQKKKFLSSSEIEEYDVEIRNHIVEFTPTEVVTRNYVFNRVAPADPIDFSLVAWIYRRKIDIGKKSSDRIVCRLENGKKQELARRRSFTESDLYHLVKEVNPSVMLGETIDNYNRYKEIVKS